MRRILYLMMTILSLLPLERVAAQRSITVYDPETNTPVRGFHIWSGRERTDTTNMFGTAALPEKFDTLLLTKPGYIALRIPSKLVKDTILVIKDYNNIGEVVVYGNRQNEFQEAVKRWTKQDRTELELRHPITGIEFNLSDILVPSTGATSAMPEKWQEYSTEWMLKTMILLSIPTGERCR